MVTSSFFQTACWARPVRKDIFDLRPLTCTYITCPEFRTLRKLSRSSSSFFKKTPAFHWIVLNVLYSSKASEKRRRGSRSSSCQYGSGDFHLSVLKGNLGTFVVYLRTPHCLISSCCSSYRARCSRIEEICKNGIYSIGMQFWANI
jgi:hypothetical protein